MRGMFTLILAFCAGCVPPMPTYTRHDNPGHDFDGDGYLEDDNDCDDQNAAIHPDAVELCNELDDDCNGLVDDSPTDMATWYLDEDGDGYGKDTTAQEACQPPGERYVNEGGDCNDIPGEDGPRIHPGAVEVCDGLHDEDCNGLVDMDDPDVAGLGTWYEDRDDAAATDAPPNAAPPATEDNP